MAYGQTGSGKTHTMLGASDKSEVRLLDLSVSLSFLSLTLASRYSYSRHYMRSAVCPPFGAPPVIRGLSTRAVAGASDKARSRALPHLYHYGLSALRTSHRPHICTGTGLNPSHICTATLRWDWAHPMPHLHRDCVLGDAALHCHGRSPERH
jgi:hypothetical protein